MFFGRFGMYDRLEFSVGLFPIFGVDDDFAVRVKEFHSGAVVKKWERVYDIGS